MKNLGDLKKRIETLIAEQGENAPVAYSIWTSSDVESFFEDQLPEDKPLTAKEIEETLHNMHRNQSAQTGLTEEMIQEEAPDSVKFRLIDPSGNDDAGDDADTY